MGEAEVVAGGERFSLDETKAIVAGYAFAETDHVPDERTPSYGDPTRVERRPRWGYRDYDCSPPDPGPELGPSDLYAAAVLNTKFDLRTAMSLRLVAPEVSAELAAVDESQTFWDLGRDEIEPEGIPDEGSPSWHAHRAWYLLYTSRHVGATITHKLLHHKRPRLFPIVDGETLPHLGENTAWVTIHDELTEKASEYQELESWFEELASRRGGVPLSRLRMHDILLWTRVKGQDGEARVAGEAILADS